MNIALYRFLLVYWDEFRTARSLAIRPTQRIFGRPGADIKGYTIKYNVKYTVKYSVRIHYKIQCKNAM